MQPVYNTTNTTATTTVQESRNRYNTLLAQALANINRRKTDKTAQPEERTGQESEEVTTTATDVTTTPTPTQQPEPVATPEEVTTEYYGYLDGKDPMQIGRIKKQLDRRIYVDDKICTWAEYIAEGYEAGQLKAYKDEYTYAKKGRDLAYHEHNVTEWVIWTAREMERGNGVVANKTIVDYARYLIKLMEAAPATAPQATEEVTTEDDTTTATEEVTTEEATVSEFTVEQENDKAPALLDLIKRYGNVGADYLDTLDYTQAEAREYRSVKRGVSKLEQKYYTTEDGTMYGLFRRYSRNGKRVRFVVYQDGQKIEIRTYGKNNSCYKAEIQYNGGEFVYNVTDGKMTGGSYTTADKLTIVRFDDSNRPETPRDLPAPAPSKPTSKETTKEEPATTEEEQPTSETATAPTPEPIDTPEEVTTVTTSKQEDDTTPYWLLLDNELREQEIDLEIAKEEAAVLAMEKEQEEAAANVEFLTGSELDKAIAEYIERNGLDLKLEKGYYYFYITTDGYIVKLNKNKPRKDLYIPDEGPFYESYKKGEVTDRSIFFSHNLETLDDYARESMRNVNYCRVERTEDGTLSIDTNNLRSEYECDKETGTYKEIPVKHPTPRELAVYVAAWNAYEADQRARLEKYWKRYSDKVCVNTYWADR